MTMSKPKVSKAKVTEADQVALDQVLTTISEHTARLTKPISDLAVVVSKLTEPLTDVAVDFQPLMRVLAKISAERCQTLEQQRQVFERCLLEYELDPNEYDWALTAHALGALVGYAETMSQREWTPGREDLAPLFDFDELTNS
jgi:hypothetical protein